MKKIYLLLLLLPLLCQAQSSSFNNWQSVGLEYDINKSLRSKVRLGYRTTDFQSSSTFLDVALQYKLHKYLKVGLGWRYAGRGNPTNVDAITNRFHTDISSKIKLAKHLYIKPRLRYQMRFKDWWVSELGYIPKHSFRARLLVNYAINKKFSLTLGGELFTTGYYYETPETNPIRLISALSYTYKKAHTFELGYTIEQDITASDQHTAHIITLSYSVHLNNLLKKIRKKRKKKRKEKL